MSRTCHEHVTNITARTYCLSHSFVLSFSIVLHQLCVLHQVGANVHNRLKFGKIYCVRKCKKKIIEVLKVQRINHSAILVTFDIICVRLLGCPYLAVFTAQYFYIFIFVSKKIPGVGFEPTRTTRPLELKSNALTTRPSW